MKQKDMSQPSLELLQAAVKLMEVWQLQDSVQFQDYILIQPEINF